MSIRESVGGGRDLTKVLERATADSVEAPLFRKRGSDIRVIKRKRNGRRNLDGASQLFWEQMEL